MRKSHWSSQMWKKNILQQNFPRILHAFGTDYYSLSVPPRFISRSLWSSVRKQLILYPMRMYCGVDNSEVREIILRSLRCLTANSYLRGTGQHKTKFGLEKLRKRWERTATNSFVVKIFVWPGWVSTLYTGHYILMIFTVWLISAQCGTISPLTNSLNSVRKYAHICV